MLNDGAATGEKLFVAGSNCHKGIHIQQLCGDSRALWDFNTMYIAPKTTFAWGYCLLVLMPPGTMYVNVYVCFSERASVIE